AYSAYARYATHTHGPANTIVMVAPLPDPGPSSMSALPLRAPRRRQLTPRTTATLLRHPIVRAPGRRSAAVARPAKKARGPLLVHWHPVALHMTSVVTAD